MKRIRLQIGIMAKLLVVFVVFCSCSSTQSITTPPNVNFSNYRIAVIRGIQLSGYTEAYYTEFQNSLLFCGYSVITEERISALNTTDQSSLMLVNVGVIAGTFSPHNVSVVITDYLSGNLLVSCKRSSWSSSLLQLVREVIKDMEKVIKK